MNENLNLCEILKGHESEIFYSPIFGNCKFIKYHLVDNYPIEVIPIECDKTCKGTSKYFANDGKYNKTYNGECMLFPSKDQRDWNKWIEEQKPKIPKTWSELVKSDIGDIVGYTLECFYRKRPQSLDYTPIEKSALALLKIHQLIEVGYRGNVSNEEWEDDNLIKFFIRINNTDMNFYIDHMYTIWDFSHIAFHTEEQADEFLSYPENVQLLKDYFMI